jgi:hypothetical protein
MLVVCPQYIRLYGFLFCEFSPEFSSSMRPECVTSAKTSRGGLEPPKQNQTLSSLIKMKRY